MYLFDAGQHVLNMLWAIREFDTERFRQQEEMKPSWKKIQSASTLNPYIGLFMILPSEGYLYLLGLVQECFKIVLRKLKESKGTTLLEKKQDDKGEGEKGETRTCQGGEA